MISTEFHWNLDGAQPQPFESVNQFCSEKESVLTQGRSDSAQKLPIDDDRALRIAGSHAENQATKDPETEREHRAQRASLNVRIGMSFRSDHDHRCGASVSQPIECVEIIEAKWQIIGREEDVLALAGLRAGAERIPHALTAAKQPKPRLMPCSLMDESTAQLVCAIGRTVLDDDHLSLSVAEASRQPLNG
jgi:hypothetical protein